MSLMKRIFSTESTGKRLSIAFWIREFPLWRILFCLKTGLLPSGILSTEGQRRMMITVTGHMSRHPKNAFSALDILLSCYPSSRHPFHHPIKRNAEQQGKHNPKHILRHTKPHCTLEP